MCLYLLHFFFLSFLMIDGCFSTERACQAYFFSGALPVLFLSLTVQSHLISRCLHFWSRWNREFRSIKMMWNERYRIQLKWYIMMLQCNMEQCPHNAHPLSYKLKRSSYILQKSIFWLIIFIRRMYTLCSSSNIHPLFAFVISLWNWIIKSRSFQFHLTIANITVSLRVTTTTTTMT